ncbi:MAG: hypothetical protein NXI16_16890 [Alphaproteobacteria bacterium]|nr:hypothetical protein [Alphaproteobacteria bacterium]
MSGDGVSVDTLVAIKGLLIVLVIFGWGFLQLRQVRPDKPKDGDKG